MRSVFRNVHPADKRPNMGPLGSERIGSRAGPGKARPAEGLGTATRGLPSIASHAGDDAHQWLGHPRPGTLSASGQYRRRVTEVHVRATTMVATPAC
jgi:hypothetical protein